MPPAGFESRTLRGHTCFNACSDYGDCLSGFDYDNRPNCRSQGEENGIICINPYLESCENYIEPNMICLNVAEKICVDWRKIIYAILIANAL
jgi:hypothetical protein